MENQFQEELTNVIRHANARRKKNAPVSYAYKVGDFCFTILIMCIMAVIIALTIKFIIWLFI